MTTPPPDPGFPTERGDASPRLLDFRSGGWVILLTSVVCLGILVWGLLGIFAKQEPRIGDGRNVESYGFNLKPTLVSIEQIVASGFSKDREVRAITAPSFLSIADLKRQTQEERGAYLVPNDRIIGVAINGEARAYPVSVLNHHEIVNDTVGGVPIAVTFNPLCDSAAVFDRRDANGATMTFGVSGLLYNSNLLMYDRREDPAGESLWCQLQARAIAGPAAEARATLALLPAAVTHWDDWVAAYPETLVLARVPAMMLRYKKQTYNPYFASDDLIMPVEPLPPTDGPPLKSQVIVVHAGNARELFHLADVIAAIDAGGSFSTMVGDASVQLHYRASPPSIWARDGDTGETLPMMTSLWFAWYATRADESASGG